MKARPFQSPLRLAALAGLALAAASAHAEVIFSENFGGAGLSADQFNNNFGTFTVDNTSTNELNPGAGNAWLSPMPPELGTTFAVIHAVGIADADLSETYKANTTYTLTFTHFRRDDLDGDGIGAQLLTPTLNQAAGDFFPAVTVVDTFVTRTLSVNIPANSPLLGQAIRLRLYSDQTTVSSAAQGGIDNIVLTATPEKLIASETFTGSPDGDSIDGTTLDTSLSGGKWVKFGVNTASFQSTATVGFGNPLNGTFGQTGQNVSAVSIASAGAYVKPTVLTISADLVTSPPGFAATTGAASAGRGVALGFYSSPSGVTDFSQNLFTGLVLDSSGSLNLVNDPNATGFFGGGSTIGTPIAFVGTWDANALRRLTYTVNTATGAISDISLEGSSATYSFTTSLFTDAATAFAGVYVSSETGGLTAGMDNFRVVDGSVGGTFADWIAGYSGVGGQTGFAQDPDGDGVPNGVEAWFGTHPGEFSQGIIAGSKSGNAFTFTHPQNLEPPSDLTGFYQWSRNLTDWYAGDGVDGPPAGPTVTITPVTTGTTTTVTATASEAMEKMFLRAGASQS